MDPVRFKFKWLDDEGNMTDLWRKSASFDGRVLQLDDTSIPVEAIVDLHLRGQSTYLWLRTQSGKSVQTGFSVIGSDGLEIQQALNRQRREALIQQEQQRLEARGDGLQLREQECEHCRSPIFLSGLPQTPQVYCPVCDSLLTTGVAPEQRWLESRHRICDECGMYSHPRKFTTFYFYFLLVIYGIWNKTTIRCPACMRGESWKMLLGNLPGLVGLPFSVVQIYRSYAKTSALDPMRGLDDANLRLRKGQIERALDDYDRLLERQPINAGVKYNIASGLVRKREFQHAQQMFEMSLDDCANYWPAVEGLLIALEQQGKEAEVEAVQRMWQVEPAGQRETGKANDALDEGE